MNKNVNIYDTGCLTEAQGVKYVSDLDSYLGQKEAYYSLLYLVIIGIIISA